MTSHLISGTRVEMLLGKIADEFTDRLQRGEHPDVDEFLIRYPELSGVLRQVLPALLVINDTGDALPESSSADPALPEGQRLLDFRLVREIARGGMGIVYEAEQISLARRVALKVLPLAAALDPRSLARFRIEAQAAAQLHHTNIVPVYSVGCDRGVHYYAMQFIEGTTLAEVIGQRRDATQPNPDANSLKPPSDSDGSATNSVVATTAKAMLTTVQAADRSAYWQLVARLGIQAAEALDYAHQRGVVHRDIKPANLLLDEFENLWITDFGLARMGQETQLTITGDLLGTWAYLSPESLTKGANRLLVDHRTDVYSLGVTLYELLTLQRAFGAEDRAETLRRIANDEPRALRDCDCRIPLELETIVLKAMEKNPEERYGTAQELADDLRRFLEHRPISAQRPTAWDRLRKWGRRHRGVVMGMVTVLATITLGTAIAGWRITSVEARAAQDRATAEQQRQIAAFNSQFAQQQKQLADEHQELAEARLAQIRWSQYATQINLAANAWKAGRMDQARGFLAACVPQTGESDLRGFEWRMLSRACRDHPVWNRHNGEVYFARFSPNGKFVATAGQDGARIWTWENGDPAKSGRQVAHLVDHQNDVNAVGWSPDSRRLVTAGDDDKARIWDTDTWKIVTVLEHTGRVCGAVFSPNGSLLATGERRQIKGADGTNNDEGHVRLWDASNWQPVAELREPGPGVLSGLDFSFDGKLLATAGRGKAAVVWDVAKRSIRYRFEHQSHVKFVAFAPDDSPLLATGSGEQVHLWYLSDDTVAPEQTYPHQSVESIAFAPNSHSFVTAGRVGDIVHWGRTKLRSNSGHLLRSGSPFWCAAYAPDNETILTTSFDGGLRLFRVDDEPFDHRRLSSFDPYRANEFRHFADVLWGPGVRASFAFSQDSQLIAQSGDAGRIIHVRRLAKTDHSPLHLGHSRIPFDDPRWVQDVLSLQDGRFLVAGPAGGIGLFRLPYDVDAQAIRSFVGLPEGKQYQIRECAATNELWMTVAKSPDRYETYAVSMDPKLQSTPARINWLDGAQFLALRSDHRQLAILSGDNELRLHDLPSGEMVTRVPLSGLNCVTWSHDGRYLAGATKHGTIELRTVPTLEREFVWAGDPKGIGCLAFSRDDRTLAGAVEGRVLLWNVATGMELMTLETDCRLDQVQFSPDGTMLGAAGLPNPRAHELLLWHADSR